MTPSKIFSAALFIVAIVLGYFLANSIATRISDEGNIAKNEEQVVQKLQWIRDAQQAYLSANGTYTDNWDSLISFIQSGNIPQILKKEHIKTLAYGADSIWYTYDTLGYVSVRDSIFSPARYPDFKPEALPRVPGSDSTFLLQAATIPSKVGNRQVPVFMAEDTYVIDKSRLKPTHPRGPLRVGSLSEASTQGNWEK
jgi:hypothetical protein